MKIKFFEFRQHTIDQIAVFRKRVPDSDNIIT